MLFPNITYQLILWTRSSFSASKGAYCRRIRKQSKCCYYYWTGPRLAAVKSLLTSLRLQQRWESAAVRKYLMRAFPDPISSNGSLRRWLLFYPFNGGNNDGNNSCGGMTRPAQKDAHKLLNPYNRAAARGCLFAEAVVVLITSKLYCHVLNVL